MLVRVAPFVVFVGLTACQGKFGPASPFWFYLIKTIAGAGMLAVVWRHIPEMRWKLSWDAAAIGVAVFGIWVGLDGLYPSAEGLFKTLLCPLGKRVGLEGWCGSVSAAPTPWNPHLLFGDWSAWGFALMRLAGSSVVVPPLEEVFYRSFLYRYLVRPEFERVPLKSFHWKSFAATSFVFGFTHHEWLAGILCGLLYQALAVRHGRLGEAMSAHAITNFLLGLWVMGRGAWHFW